MSKSKSKSSHHVVPSLSNQSRRQKSRCDAMHGEGSCFAIDPQVALNLSLVSFFSHIFWFARFPSLLSREHNILPILIINLSPSFSL
jgi:hypothetical protein